MTTQDQPKSLTRPDAPRCAACGHPAVYHGRALPRCDGCDCAGYRKTIRAARTPGTGL